MGYASSNTRISVVQLIELPDYLVEVVAKQIYSEQYPPASYPLWEDADETVQEGCREVARIKLRAQAAQTDIPR